MHEIKYATLGEAVRRSPLINRPTTPRPRLTPADAAAIRRVARSTATDPVDLIVAAVEELYSAR